MILVDCINEMGFIIRILAKLVYYIRIIVPILLIIFVIYDFAKVIVGNALEKDKKEAINKVVKRLIYAIIVFLVPTIINLIFTKIEQISPTKDSNGNATSWVSCWNYYYNQVN